MKTIDTSITESAPTVVQETEKAPKRLVPRIKVAARLWDRLRGLLGRVLADDEGLYITRCNSVHTVGMAYPIDVVFLDAERKALALYHELKPWRATRRIRHACGALELPAGTLKKSGLKEGERVEIPKEAGTDGSLSSKIWVNLILSAFWVYFAANLLPVIWRGDARPSTYMLFIVNTFIAILFLIRREEKRVTEEPADRLVTVACIFMGFSLRPAEGASLISQNLESILLTGSLILIFAAYSSLGRSFGLIPADRGLKLGGMYKFIRHPL